MGRETIEILSDLDENKLGGRAGRPEFDFEGPGGRNGDENPIFIKIRNPKKIAIFS